MNTSMECTNLTPARIVCNVKQGCHNVAYRMNTANVLAVQHETCIR